MVTAKNPILSGFYPDPSVCAVGEDYYLVLSTFAYFPGVPIFHSKDLAHWEQIGHVLDRPSQLPLEGCGHSDGIFAPTLRYHDGVFYMITTNVSGSVLTTNVSGRGNFVVTARDPKGPWSEPHWLDSPGIDPSLFFDEDGSCYYVGTRPDIDGPKYRGDWEVWCQRLDLETMKLTGESRRLWKGALKNVVWPEGPHLYKKDGYYYLMIAEGGTGAEHCITIARSREVFGPYEGYDKNPIITHRHLGKNYPVTWVGHGDLVQAADGSWYMVLLATRPCKGYSNMGRETFLARVEWEDGWPVVNPGIGRLEETVACPGELFETDPLPPVYSFMEDRLPMEFMTLRNAGRIYSLTERRGALRLYLQPETLKEKASPAYVGVRQTSQDYQIAAWMEFVPEPGEEAGLAIVQSNEYHIRFVKTAADQGTAAQVIYCEDGEDRVLAERQISEGPCVMRVIGRALEAKFICEYGNEKLEIAKAVDLHMLSTQAAGGFVGCTVGMYASSNGKAGKNWCDYRWFSYQNLT